MPKHILIRQFMSPRPETIEEDLTLQDAKERMFALGVRHLPCLHDGKLIGVLSQRDIAVAEALFLGDDDGKRVTVRSVMTQVPFTCGPDAHLDAVAREMAAKHIGSAVVVDPAHPTKVVGVFTTVDALTALAAVISGDAGA